MPLQEPDDATGSVASRDRVEALRCSRVIAITSGAARKAAILAAIRGGLQVNSLVMGGTWGGGPVGWAATMLITGYVDPSGRS